MRRHRLRTQNGRSVSPSSTRGLGWHRNRDFAKRNTPEWWQVTAAAAAVATAHKPTYYDAWFDIRTWCPAMSHTVNMREVSANGEQPLKTCSDMRACGVCICVSQMPTLSVLYACSRVRFACFALLAFVRDLLCAHAIMFVYALCECTKNTWTCIL